MFSKLAVVLTTCAVAEAHVRGIYVMSSIRNAGNGAPQPAGNGQLSTSGPCGGSQTFGRNGVNEVRTGDTVTLSMAYNGGHASNDNHFQLAIQCGKPGNDAVFKKTSGTGLNVVRANKLTSNPPLVMGAAQTDTPVSLTFVVPTEMPGTDGDLCTVSMLDQRDWGSCVDFKFLAAAGPPAPTPEPVTLDDKSFSTTFKIGEKACANDSPNCACVDGSITIEHVAGSMSANANFKSKTVTHTDANGVKTEMSGIEKGFGISQIMNTAAMQITNGGKLNTRLAADGDPIENFEIQVFWSKDGLTLSGVNVADAPKYCGFDVSQVDTIGNSGSQSIASAMVVAGLALFAA